MVTWAAASDTGKVLVVPARKGASALVQRMAQEFICRIPCVESDTLVPNERRDTCGWCLLRLLCHAVLGSTRRVVSLTKRLGWRAESTAGSDAQGARPTQGVKEPSASTVTIRCAHRGSKPCKSRDTDLFPPRMSIDWDFQV